MLQLEDGKKAALCLLAITFSAWLGLAWLGFGNSVGQLQPNEIESILGQGSFPRKRENDKVFLGDKKCMFIFLA